MFPCEERIASLEGGIGAVATGSGQAAGTPLFMQLCDAGDHIVASSALYGGTYTLLNVTLRRLGVDDVRRARRPAGVCRRDPAR
jgi:O-acetylhomoserine (thiol)-lyase